MGSISCTNSMKLCKKRHLGIIVRIVQMTMIVLLQWKDNIP